MGRERTPTTELIRSSAIRTASVLAVALLAWILWHARLALFVTAVSLLIAVALDRAVCAMGRRGVPRGAGIAIVLTSWAAVLIALAVVFAIPAARQLQQLAVSAPQLFEQIRGSDLYATVARHVPEETLRTILPDRAGDVFSSAVGFATGVVGAVAGIVTVFFVTAFMLGSGRSLVGVWLAAARPAMRARYQVLLDRLYDAIGGYVTGLSIIVAVDAALTTTVLGILKIPWFLALGLLVGLSSLIPYVGILVAGAVVVVVAGLSNGVFAAAATLAWVVFYQQIENHILSPLVYRRAVNVNPLVLIVVALVLAEVSGIAGAVLSVPIAAVGQIVLAEVLRFRRETPHEEPVGVLEVKQVDRG
jgi:predicted PurR-regulated permease PerM